MPNSKPIPNPPIVDQGDYLGEGRVEYGYRGPLVLPDGTSIELLGSKPLTPEAVKESPAGLDRRTPRR